MKRFIFFIITGILLLFIYQMSNSIISLWQKQDVIIKAKKQFTQVEKQNTLLKEKLSQVNNKQFIEKEARNNLFLLKPGEKIVIVPSQTTITSRREKTFAKPPSFLQEWIQIFNF